jgi:7-cyano-7-deazaguanine synthase
MPHPDVAVLCSGGLDSAVLVAYEARDHRVLPVYISAGLSWESEERAVLQRLLEAPEFAARVEPYRSLRVDVTDLYAVGHWALRAAPPAYDTPDEDVYLAGRNVLLLSKAAVLCASLGIRRVAVGTLAGNPFPDATPTFFAAMARAVSLGLAHDMDITAPLAQMHKEEVVRLGAELGVPFDLTMSCMNPARGRHCGQCSKCRERRDAFDAAGVADPTVYAAPSPRKAPDSGLKAQG